MTTATKPWAVVTGASGGIGLEPAKQFARHDSDLLLAAAAADEVRACGTRVEAVRTDLADAAGVGELVRHVAGRRVEAPAVNAGVGSNGEFAEDALREDQLTVVDLDVRSAVHLTKRTVPAMIGRSNEIAEAGFEALRAGEGKVVPGAAKNKLQSAASRVLPDEVEAKQQGKMIRPGSAEE
ncbi:SDR family oxidoreductase [Amycolatopsis sp. FBCC-B4732]|uniref:SDR family NAD(P)-dependent oxidoreductase n=1 Tax=Amycolatopsis sp. FBCC-B4732 TaxID=3079339 RepID=UPI001FF19406|nr:SDR family NAD(P)-dependent oxidoreductase [Amycolatopsis sp. FBCC-B4732]UOX92299.1 SDR family oxidoreductase [Amycolatopsis sp. FBCC-B4732]